MQTILPRRLTPPWASSRGTLDLHLKLQRRLPTRPSSVLYWSMPLHPGHLFDTDNEKIEKVQRRAARFVMKDYRRTKMLTNIDWDTLQERRDLARLSMMYHIVHGLVDIPAESYLTPSTSTTRGHNFGFRQIRTSNSTYQQSFFPEDHCTVEPTPPDCHEPDNAGSLPEPSGFPHLLNATPCSYQF